MADNDFIRFTGICKHFGGVAALQDVSLTIPRGQVHALMGENGAGKSTLGKILAGIHRPDAGEIHIEGTAYRFHSPMDALRAGVAMVHQELAYCPDLSVAENLHLGRYPRRAGFLLDRSAMRRHAGAMLKRIGVEMNLDQPMRDLTTGSAQLVQIANAVGGGARILIFDEPTSSLSQGEADRLFDLVERLRGEGVTIIYVSHRMPEVARLADQVSVLRDGRYIGTLTREQADPNSLVKMMIGRTLAEYFPQHLQAQPGEIVLDVQGLTSPGKFRDVSFQVRKGEIVGLAGLVGAGRSEVAQAIFGLDDRAQGVVKVRGQTIAPGQVSTAMKLGVGLIPEDRKKQGLILMMSCRGNFSLVILDRLKRMGLLDHGKERRETITFFERLKVKTASIEAPVESLSGGNQQKVVVAKWLAMQMSLLIVDEPTRGVDVGAKAAIHTLIDELAHQGIAILLISSELPEVLNLSTRVLVMRQGRIAGEIPRAQATQDAVMRVMANVPESATA